MRRIEILDCTLRDGAQVNEARFGENAICDIITGLCEAHIDMVECGFLKNVEFEPGRTYFPQPGYAKRYLPKDRGSSTLTALVDFGRYDIDNLEPCDGSSFDLIRVSLFEKDIDNIFDFCMKVKERGYRLSIQPMDTYSYSEENVRKVIQMANRIKPETLSIVDTYSVATTDDVVRVYKLYEESLSPGIKIGFHSHNNQLNSFALARKFIEVSNPDRGLVIDCSLYGMGRGGGNLNTELFTEYLNKEYAHHYQAKPILDMIDRYLIGFKEKYEWGYSIPMLYAGLYGVHVHTVAYLQRKPGMTSYDLKCIFAMLDEKKKKRYDYDYLDTVYEKYMSERGAEHE